MISLTFFTGALLIGIVLGTILGTLVTMRFQRRRHQVFRAKNDIPNLLGKWRCQWFDQEIPTGEPKVEDVVEILHWTTKGEFVAKGHQPQFHLDYPIVGDVDSSRVVTLAYRAGRYPFEPNRGVACLELSRDGNSMEGFWIGRRFSNRLGGGEVRCSRIQEPIAA
jgi:hypothetical protein